MTSPNTIIADLTAEVESLRTQRDELLAEFSAYKEGSEEAFGVVVDQKRSAEYSVAQLNKTISLQKDVIFTFREKINRLLNALENCRPVMENYSGSTRFNEFISVIEKAKGCS